MQLLLRLESSREILDDVGIFGIVQQHRAVVDVAQVRDQNMISFPAVGDVQSVAGAALGVAGMQVCGKDRAAQLDLFAVLERAIHFHRREPVGISEQEVGLAAGLEQLHFFLHRDHFGAGEPLHFGFARGVIAVRVRHQQNLDVGQLEPQLGRRANGCRAPNTHSRY